MELIFLLITLAALGTLIIKCLKREDEIIELEDKIIADFREFRKNAKMSKTTAGIKISYENKIRSDRAA